MRASPRSITWTRSDEVAATLAVVVRRSAAGSRLVVAYMQARLLSHLLGFVVRRAGEPLRSSFTAGAMRDLLGTHDFVVVRDEDVPTIAAELSSQLARDTRHITHLRIATARLRG